MTKEETREYMRKWRESHPDYQRNWRKAHPGYQKKREEEKKRLLELWEQDSN